MKRLFFALFLIATPATAETPMTGAEFDAYTLGKTLGYGVDGAVWGIEEYLPDHKVRWAFVGEDCKTGHWFERTGGQICFVYQDDTGEHCWQFFLDGGRLNAQSISDAPGAPLAELTSDHGLTCPGPDVGV